MSVIDNLFSGQMIDTFICTTCNKITVHTEIFRILTLPIAAPSLLDGLVYLEDCFAAFGAIENLTGDDQLHCEQCSHAHNNPCRERAEMNCNLRRSGETSRFTVVSQPNSTDALSPIPSINQREEILLPGSTPNECFYQTSTPMSVLPPDSRSILLPLHRTDGKRRSLLGRLGDCIIIQLMRFTFLGGETPTKIHLPVHVQVRDLNLAPQTIDVILPCTTTTPYVHCRYNLYGFCVHLGGQCTSNGHYVAYTIADDGKWYMFDDERVRSVDVEHELSLKHIRENVYLLFYHSFP